MLRNLIAAILVWSVLLVPAHAMAAGTYNKGGSAGVVLVTESTLPGTGNSTLIYRITNATNSSDCAAGTPGTARADCRWNGTAYEPIGVAASGLTNPLVSDLVGASFDVTGVDEVGAVNVNKVLFPSIGTLQAAIDACQKGSNDADPACKIVLPPGRHAVTSTIRLGGSTTATMQNGFEIGGHGAGFLNSLGNSLSGTTLYWAGADGGTVMQVSGFGHWVHDLHIEGRSCVDLWSAGGPPQTTGAPDGLCDSDGATSQVQAAYGIKTTGDNSQSAPTGKNVFERIVITGVLDASAGYGIAVGDGTAGHDDQNDQQIFEQVRFSENRHCILHTDSQAVGNEFRMIDCRGNTADPAIDLQYGHVSFYGGFMGNELADAEGFSIDYCMAEFTIDGIAFENFGGGVYRAIKSNNGFGGACGFGNNYQSRITNNRIQMLADSSASHYCLDWDAQGSLLIQGNIWMSNSAGVARRCAINLPAPGTRDRFITMAGNKTAWANGSDSTDIAITISAAGGALNKVLRGDRGRWELLDKDGATALAKDVTGLYVDADNDGVFDADVDARVLDHEPRPNVSTAVSPAHVISHNLKSFFALDGQKSPVQGEGGGILKTKAVAAETEFVNLTESEGYGAWIQAFGGGDTDLVGQAVDVYGTGGSHASGDEGYQALRAFVSDKWLNAVGTVTPAIAAGAGTSSVAIGSITEAESKMLGENKLAVFAGSGANVQIVDMPPGAQPIGGPYDDPGVWSSVGGGAGQGVWTLGSGQVTSSGVQATGWCFGSNASATADLNGDVRKSWLKVVAINAGANTITTRWENQGFDAGVPLGYLATEGVNQGRVSPCADIEKPEFDAGDWVADRVSLIRGAGFPGTAGGAAFEVVAYPGIRQMGANLIFANSLGRMYDSSGVHVLNLLDGSNLGGGFQQGAAFDPAWSGDLANLLDGREHGWEYGLRCDSGDCETGFYYRYNDATSEQAMSLTFGSTAWAASTTLDVIRVLNVSQVADLTLDPTDGWGQNGDPFARLGVLDDSINAGVPNGSGAKVHWSQLLGVPAGFADGSDDGSGGGGGNLDGLTDVVITTPATGATLIFDGANWLDGALNLADSDAVTGQLLDANVDNGITASNYLPLAGGTLTGSLNLTTGFAINVPTGATVQSTGGTIVATSMSGGSTIDDNDLAAGAVDGGTGGEIEDATLTAADLGPGSLTAADAAADLATQAELDALTLPNSGQTGNRIVKSTGTAGDVVESGASLDASNNLSGVGTAAFTGTVTAPSFDPNAPAGTGVASLVFKEGVTDGSNTVTIQGPAGGFAANRSCTLQDDATPLDNCVSGGSGGAPTTVPYFTNAADGTLSAEIVAGTGVATAFAINVGSAGAFVTNGGALGTPSSGNASNLTNIPAANVTGSLDLGTGTIRGAVSIESTTSTSHTLASAEGQWLLADETGTTTVSLPAASSGANVCVYAKTDQQIHIDPNGVQVMVLNGTALTGGNKISSPASPTAGNFACVLSDGTSWFVLGKAGTWTDGG